MKPIRWQIVLTGILACLFKVAAQAEPLPNILFIMADDLGYGDLSSYGATDLSTPHIDSIAERGVRLTNFYTNSSICSPTRAALLTGKFSDLAGVPGVVRPDSNYSYGFLNPELKLMPHYLQQSGYATALIGKWHLGLSSPNLPNERGFQLFRGLLGGTMDYYSHEYRGVNYLRHNGTAITADGHATDVFTDWTIEFLREQQDSGSPFFLFLSYTAPHLPIQPPAEYVERVRTHDPDMTEARMNFAALVEHLDDNVGRVLKTLEETGQLKETLVVFVSDNGGVEQHGSDNGPLRGGKTDLFEGGIKVPGMAMWPGRIEPGTIREDVMLTMDWLPTFAALFGLDVAHGVDGRDMSPVLLGGEAQPNDRTLVWVRREGWEQMGIPHYAVRQGDHKLVVDHASGRPLLFNLAEDPFERNPLKVQAGRQIKGKLENLLQAHIIESGRVPWRDPAGKDLGLPD